MKSILFFILGAAVILLCIWLLSNKHCHFSFSTYIKFLVKVCLIILFSAIVCTLLMCAVFKFKGSNVNLNVEKSAYELEDEGYYCQESSYYTSQIDNYTDSLMLLESGNDKKASVLEKAMLVYRDSIDDSNPFKTLVGIYVDDIPATKTETYSRYWHGYLTLLMPLLQFTDYKGIRNINRICIMLLFVFFIFILIKKEKKYLILPYIISVLMLTPTVIAKCIQFSSCYYILTISSLCILCSKDINKNGWLIFLLTGISVVFFDFLTYPIATFGFPTIVYFSCDDSNTIDVKLRNFIKFGILWCIGYGFMWASKWVIASIVTEENVILDGINKVLQRTSNMNQNAELSIIQTVRKNYSAFFYTPITLLFAIYVCYYLFLIAKLLVNRKVNTKQIIYDILPYLLIMLLPVLWYSFATNHSTIHSWFTNKCCVVTVFAIMACLASMNHKLNK